MSKYPDWTKEELDILRKLWASLPASELSFKHIMRSPMGIKLKAGQLNLKTDRRLRLRRSWAVLNENPYKSLNVKDLAYIAGIIDGEGFITLDKGHDCWRLGIVNTYKPLIDWLCSKIVYSRVNNRQHIEGNKQAWLCYLAGNIRVMAILEVLMPYLMVKKEKALAVIEHIYKRYDLQRRIDKNNGVAG